MKKIYAFLLLPIISFAQVTIRVTSIPANTPANASVYMAGSLNTWNPGNAAYILQPDGLGNRQIIIPEGTGTVGFKFTRGSWATVEGNATGGFLPDRSFTFTGSPQTINLTIQSWEDLGGGGNSTAASNVQIMDTDFYMPQLDRYRRIWLYLPPDYETSTKDYPVLYMQDGQNLFDSTTSFAGEWEVDETLNNLFEDGDFGAIVVGIDNGGGERLNEYSPWVNPNYGGGDGDDYMAFLAETLKPYIDANYRTRPEPAMNALIGSSMGALIATYGAVEYPESFHKIGSLSPAYWFASVDLNNYIIANTASLANHRVYFVAGMNESPTMVTDMDEVRNNLYLEGILPINLMSHFDSDGTHTESYWRSQFGALYQWLFANENLSAPAIETEKIRILQASSGKLHVTGIPVATNFQIVSMTGALVQEITLQNGVFELPELSQGIYVLRSTDDVVQPMRIIKR